MKGQGATGLATAAGGTKASRQAGKVSGHCTPQTRDAILLPVCSHGGLPAYTRTAPKMQGLPVIVLPMPKASPALNPALPPTYEAALAELEQLVGRMESGDLPLDQMLAGYQRGADLLKFCRDRLEAVENQIKVLDGGALKPWTSE